VEVTPELNQFYQNIDLPKTDQRARLGNTVQFYLISLRTHITSIIVTRCRCMQFMRMKLIVRQCLSLGRYPGDGDSYNCWDGYRYSALVFLPMASGGISPNSWNRGVGPGATDSWRYDHCLAFKCIAAGDYNWHICIRTQPEASVELISILKLQFTKAKSLNNVHNPVTWAVVVAQLGGYLEHRRKTPNARCFGAVKLRKLHDLCEVASRSDLAGKVQIYSCSVQ